MIKITLRNFRGFTNQHPAEFIIGDGVSAFIGVNNAGKSTCLRSIYELRELFSHINYWCGLTSGRTSFNCQMEPDTSIFLNFSNEDPAFVSIEVDLIDEIKAPQLTKSVARLNRDNSVEFIYLEIQKSDQTKIKIQNIKNSQQLTKNNINQGATVLCTTQEGDTYEFSDTQMREKLNLLINSSYYGPYRNAINDGGSNQYYDISVGSALIAQWDLWKAGANTQFRRATSKVEQDIERLLGYKSIEIYASNDKKSLNVTANKYPFRLNDLGAGVAQLIITLANALIKKPSFILIDEPESHLHPSLQVEFLSTLASYASNGIAFSTHSIGLAQTFADRTYVIKKSENDSICELYQKSTNVSDLLSNLTYSGYYSNDSKYILLVEGTTEVKVIQEFLRKQNKLQLYAVIPLGGSSLIRANVDHELSEVIKIATSTDRVYGIIDSEKTSSTATLDDSRMAFKETCEALGITLHITQKRATENYFSDKAIKQALGQNFVALSEFELISSKQYSGWSKSDNWKIAQYEDMSFFTSNDLGRFLKGLPAT
jgi:predicted ATP-dependent endonuclease of OLD family